MTLYMSGGALMLLTLVYLPIVLLLVWGLWRKLPPKLPIRIVISVVAVTVTTAIPLWDVVITSVQMSNLCRSAGLKVHKTVHVDGYLTNFGGGLGEVSLQGFTYIERRVGPGQVKVYTKHDGKEVEQVLGSATMPYEPKSRYEYIYGEIEIPKGTLNLMASRSYVKDRETNEILGEALSYTAYPGWFDRNTIQQLGRHVWLCPDVSALADRLRHETLKPLARRPEREMR